jgi:hypothetical protein
VGQFLAKGDVAIWQRAMNLKNPLCKVYPYNVNLGHGGFLLFVALNKTTVAHYDADRRGIQPIILARCPVLPDHFTVLKTCRGLVDAILHDNGPRFASIGGILWPQARNGLMRPKRSGARVTGKMGAFNRLPGMPLNLFRCRTVRPLDGAGRPP